MEKYRIIKKSWRRDDTAEVKSFYQIQYLGRGLFFRKYKWKNCEQEVCGYGDCYSQNVTFDKLEDAENWVKNRLIPVPSDEVICTAERFPGVFKLND